METYIYALFGMWFSLEIFVSFDLKTLDCLLRKCLCQGWATLFGWRATLETNLDYAGRYKYPKDIFIDKTVFFINLLKRSTLRGICSVRHNVLQIVDKHKHLHCFIGGDIL
jgi:hypothetical protein